MGKWNNRSRFNRRRSPSRWYSERPSSSGNMILIRFSFRLLRLFEELLFTVFTVLYKDMVKTMGFQYGRRDSAK